MKKKNSFPRSTKEDNRGRSALYCWLWNFSLYLQVLWSFAEADLEGVTYWPVTTFFSAIILHIKPTDYIKATKYRHYSLLSRYPLLQISKFITIYLLSRQFLHMLVVYFSCCNPATYGIELNNNFFKNNYHKRNS